MQENLPTTRSRDLSEKAEPGSSLPLATDSNNPLRRTIETAPLMALAAFLIVNSHLEEFYPKAFLAADGLLGNSLFFFLSGLGLDLSQSRRQRSFLSYYRQRIVRLYPALILCVFVFSVVAGNAWSGWSLAPYAKRYLWPTGYTYFKDIVPFYAIFFFVMRLNSANAYAAALFLTVPLYLVLYIPDARQISNHWHLSMGSRPGYVHDVAYFQVMLFGGLAAKLWKQVTVLQRSPRLIYLVTAIVLATYLTLKYVMVVQARIAKWYCLLHLLVFVSCGCLLLALTSSPVVRLYRSIRPVNWLIDVIAALTLEIYLVHLYLVGYPWLARIRFPFNIMVLAALTLFFAALLSRAVRPVQRLLRERDAV